MKIFSKIIGFVIVFALSINANAQELNAQVILNAQAIQNNVDVKIFKNLEQSLKDFLNTTKFTKDEYGALEKIECQFNLTIQKVGKEANSYEAKLSINASRPVYGADYQSSILNYIDKEVMFKYVQFQPVDFNETRVAGNDPLAANLSAIFAYYAYYIIGLDMDSYKQSGGSDYFNKARNIVSNAPEGYGIDGWKPEGSKNRYWLVDNILNSRFIPFREAYYYYHRNGLDQMTTNAEEANIAILNTISTIYQVNMESPGSALLLAFFSTKNAEYLNILTQASMEEKLKLVPMLSMLDVPNASKYSALLKQ